MATTPKLGDLTLELRDLSWEKIRQVANQLKIENVDLDDIKAKNKDRHERLSRVMELWLRNGAKPSWEKLAEVLDSVNEKNLADHIKKTYCRSR